MKNSDSIIENTVSFKMLKCNSCKIQSYAIGWSMKCNVVLENCYTEVIAVRQSGIFGSSPCFRTVLTASHVSHNTGIWIKKISNTGEMYSVPRIVNSEHYSGKGIDMSIPQTLLIGFDSRGKDKEDEDLMRC